MSGNLPDKSNSQTLIREDFQMIHVEKVSQSTLTLKCPKEYQICRGTEARANDAENRALLQAQFNNKSRQVYLQVCLFTKKRL